MTETIGVLVIFFILLLFGLVLYSQFQKRSIAEQKEQFYARQAIITSLKATFMNDIGCESTEQTGTCIDFHRLDALKEKLSEPEFNQFYSSLLSTSHVWIEDLIAPKNITIYSSIKANYTKLTSVPTPILLRNALEEYDHFAVLHVDVYS